MSDEPRLDHRLLEPANDGRDCLTRVDEAVLTLARLIGRQIAREHFERGLAANDNGASPETAKD